MPRLDSNLPRALAALQQVTIEQAGVCTYPQAISAGLSPGAIRRLADAGEWHRLHRGIFDTTGAPPVLHARMWGAHLALGELSVVAGAAAGHSWGLLDGPWPADRSLRMLLCDSIRRRSPGLDVRRVWDPLSRAHPARRPPMLTVEHTVLDLAGLAATDADAIELVLRAHRLRLTTPERIEAVLEEVRRVRRRRLVHEACNDASLGLTSHLERRYRRDVERRHGLPVGALQVREWAGGTVYRDVLYEAQGVIVELDGRLGHESERGVLRDQFRDNRAALTGRATLRYGWLAVAGHSCESAGQVAALLLTRGWADQPRRCGPTCELPRMLLSGAA